jgi:hypothetical protein
MEHFKHYVHTIMLCLDSHHLDREWPQLEAVPTALWANLTLGITFGLSETPSRHRNWNPKGCAKRPSSRIGSVRVSSEVAESQWSEHEQFSEVLALDPALLSRGVQSLLRFGRLADLYP